MLVLVQPKIVIKEAYGITKLCRSKLLNLHGQEGVKCETTRLGPGSKARNQRTVSSDESCVLEGLDMGIRILVFAYGLSDRLVDDVIEKYPFSHGPRPRILLRRASDFSPTAHSQFCVRPGRRSGLQR